MIPFSHGHMAATRVCSSPYPVHCPSWTRSLRVTHELRGRQPQWLCSEFVPFLLLFDCQEAFHCCLVVTCINRINMISIQCHRVGEWWSGKPEFENVSDPAGVYIPFKNKFGRICKGFQVTTLTTTPPQVSLKEWPIVAYIDIVHGESQCRERKRTQTCHLRLTSFVINTDSSWLKFRFL